MVKHIDGIPMQSDERTLVLKEYFSRYLTDVRGLRQSSVKHYIDALHNISMRLANKGFVKKDIYEILDLDTLHTARELLMADPDFVDLNTRGNHMYSAGLNNYMRFAEGTDFQSTKGQETKMDIPIAVKADGKTEVIVHKRSDILRTHTLAFADYRCEMNHSHESFIAEKTNKPYMEVHHAIPMKWQSEFAYSLDVYANLISLCPICHRKIHYGRKTERLKMVHQIYAEREERLVKSGLSLSRDEFAELVMR